MTTYTVVQFFVDTVYIYTHCSPHGIQYRR